jgi:hypothetical protein
MACASTKEPAIGFFAEDVLARFQSGTCRRAMHVVVQANIDRLNVIALQQFAKIGVHLGNRVLTGDALRFLLVDVGNRDDFHFRNV